MGFFATHVYLRGNLRVRLATPTQVSTQVQLASTCDYLPLLLTSALTYLLANETEDSLPQALVKRTRK